MLDRLRRPVTPEGYRRVTVWALVLLVVIVVTGAGVRLTGSGLGCSDWPNCTETTFVAPMELNPMIEFVNRLITGAVSAAVGLAVLGSLRRAPRRRDLTWLSLGLVAGVLGQVLLGALVVWSHLNPWLVQGHFVLSAVLIVNATVLVHRAALPDDRRSRPAVTPAILAWGRTMLGAAIVVILSGTLVTGSGPHSGHSPDDPYEVRRLPIDVGDAARVHGLSMVVFLAITIWVLAQLRRHRAAAPLQRAGSQLLTVVVLQGALGYTQYFTGVPPLLVGLHILGSTLVLVAVVNLVLRMRQPLESDTAGPRDSEREPGADHLPDGDLLTQR